MVKAITSKFKINMFFTIVFILNLTTVDLGCQLLLIGLFRVRFSLGAAAGFTCKICAKFMPW